MLADPGYGIPDALGHGGNPGAVAAAIQLQHQHRQALANQYALHQINRAMAAGLIPAGHGVTGDPAAYWRQLSAQLFTNNPQNVNTFLGRPNVNPAAVPAPPAQQTVAGNPALAQLFNQ